MPTAIRDTTDHDLTAEEWNTISNVCKGLKWWPLIEKMMIDGNAITELSALDGFLRKEEIAEKNDRYPTWSIAAPAINAALHKAGSPYRLKKVKVPPPPKAMRNAYQGKVHFKQK